MSHRDIIVGSILGGLAILCIVVAAFHQPPQSHDTHLNDPPKDPSSLRSGSPLDTEANATDSAAGQTSELEAFEEAVQALKEAKEAVAGRCVRLLALPIDGLLAVVKACSVSSDLDFESHLTQSTALNV